MTEPSPRPAARDSAAAVFDTDVATLARSGFLVVTVDRLADRRPVTVHATLLHSGR